MTGEEITVRQSRPSDVPALVAFEDEGAASFWERAGYPLDRQIGRRVRNLTEPET